MGRALSWVIHGVFQAGACGGTRNAVTRDQAQALLTKGCGVRTLTQADRVSTDGEQDRTAHARRAESANKQFLRTVCAWTPARASDLGGARLPARRVITQSGAHQADQI